jgi:hypothetical protein
VTDQAAARQRLRDERASWLAVVDALKATGREPVVLWQCASPLRKGRGACVLLAVYRAPDGRFVVHAPNHRHRSQKVAAGLALDTTRAAIAAELETLLEASGDGLIAGLLSCKHFEGDESAARLRQDVGAGRRVQRFLPDSETPVSFVSRRG